MAKKSTARLIDLATCDAEYVAAINKLASEWRELSSQFKIVKEAEMEKRRELAILISQDENEIGKYEVILGDGSYKLSLEQKHAVSLDNDLAVLTVNNLVDCPPIMRADLINFKASLSLASYNKLSEQDQLIMSEAVSFKPSTPTLKVQILEVK